MLAELFEGANGYAPLFTEGLRVLGQQPGDYSSKLQLALDPVMTAGEASRRIHLNLVDTLERNEDGTARNIDSEFLHDFRVAIRRIRSALSQIDKTVLPVDVVATAKQDFRWVGQQTNRMRDLDVYLIAFPGYRAGLPAEYRRALDPFHDHLAKESRRESRKIAAMIGNQDYRKIRDRWRRYVSTTEPSPEDGPDAMTPVRELANARIWKAYRRLIREGSAIDDDSPNAMLHDLRITGKKLRYLLEFFQSLYPKDELNKLVSALKKLQNVLGDFQDSEVQSHAIRDFAREMAEGGSVPVETQMAMGMVAESILTRQSAARSAFHSRFVEFASPEVREIFVRLFKS
jgi:CHAD domain-containing protein